MRKAGVLLGTICIIAMLGIVGENDVNAEKGINPRLKTVTCQVNSVYNDVHGQSTLDVIMPDGSIHIYVVDSADVYGLERGDYVDFATMDENDYTKYMVTSKN